MAPPDEVRHALIDQLAPFHVPGRRVPPQNWHLTLRFLGEVDPVTVDRFTGSLDERDLGDSFRLTLSGLGAFPNSRKAAVIWAGLESGELRLHQLAESCDEASADAGVAPEDRPFAPHLSLSRVRPPVDATSLIDSVELEIMWRVDEVVLFETVGARGGVRYEPLETFPLSR